MTINNNIELDNVLASQIRSGNKEAFRQFYDLYNKKIYGFAFSYLKSHDEAEEVIQAVFVKIWETRSDIRDNLSLKSYLFKITVNHIYNLFKHNKIREQAVDNEFYLSGPLDNSTQENIYFNNLKENIDVLVDQMPKQRRLIFILSRMKGLSHEEIARKMNLSERTVESQIYKALKFLRKNLKEELLLLLFLL